jgi:hypothetical protein
MEGLAVDGEDRHLRTAVERGIVQCADFQDRGGQARRNNIRVRVSSPSPVPLPAVIFRCKAFWLQFFSLTRKILGF